MKILVVEDNPVNATMVRVTLEKEHYETVLAPDGEEALALLEAHPDVDLVITDVMMPNVGGLEMLVALGLPNGDVPAHALAGAYKALVTELQLLSEALPAPSRKCTRLVEDNPLDGAEGAAASENAEGESGNEPAAS